MIIDLHCHTHKCKSGDPASREVTPHRFKEAIVSSGVKIVGITNHNSFDLTQFHELSREVAQEAQVWPGVELDVHGTHSDSHWHMIVVSSPASAEKFSSSVNALIDDASPNSFCADIRTVFDHFKDLNSIYISHCHDKSPFLGEREVVEMESLVSERWRLFYEPKTLVTVGIWSNHGRNMMLGSDVQDWSKYPSCELPKLRLPVDSFEQFCLLAQRDDSTIETLLGHKGAFDIVAHPESGVDVPLRLSEDINVIFGQKGTGKTRIIKSIEGQLLEEGHLCCSYYGSDKHESFERLVSLNGITRDSKRFNRTDGEDLLANIRLWHDETITPLSSYVDWWRTRSNSEKKKRFKLSEADNLRQISDQVFKDDLDMLATAEEIEKDIEDKDLTRYLSVEDSKQLLHLIELLGYGALSSARNSYIQFKSIQLANKGLDSLKRAIDAKSDTRSRPGTTGFQEFALNRLKLRNIALEILNGISPDEKSERTYLGTLEDKGQVYVVTRYRYLDKESRADEFEKISELKKWQRAIHGLVNSSIGREANQAFEQFKEADAERRVLNLSEFIGIRRFTTISDDNSPYAPSSGEEGILVLEQTLSKDADIYLLDEVEVGMSNSYIDAVIRERIQDLAHQGKTIIVATHNANIAVRTLPYSSIYREHVEGDHYRTYVGNPFANRLTEIHGEVPPLSWTEKSLEVLEGGHAAFYNRREVYEAGSHE